MVMLGFKFKIVLFCSACHLTKLCFNKHTWTPCAYGGSTLSKLRKDVEYRLVKHELQTSKSS